MPKSIENTFFTDAFYHWDYLYRKLFVVMIILKRCNLGFYFACKGTGVCGSPIIDTYLLTKESLCKRVGDFSTNRGIWTIYFIFLFKYSCLKRHNKAEIIKKSVILCWLPIYDHMM